MGTARLEYTKKQRKEAHRKRVKIKITQLYHRVDSVIERLLREIIESKNFALINLNLNFCETTIYDNKVVLENLVAVH